MTRRREEGDRRVGREKVVLQPKRKRREKGGEK
jgi:hypothetical protein